MSPSPTTAPADTAAATLDPKLLSDALATVKPVVSTRSAVKALSGVRVIVGDGQVRLAATNMETWVRKTLAAITREELDTVVPHAELAKAAKLFLKRDVVRLADDDGDLTVTDGKRTITLRSLRTEDFPPEPDWNAGKPSLVADGDELLRTLARIIPFASKDQTRPILTGLKFEPRHERNPHPTLVGTDSYRLAAIRAPGYSPFGAVEALIPADALKVAAKSMKGAGEVSIRVADNYAVIDIPAAEVIFTTRTISGQYPNYRQLIPDSYELTVDLPRLAMLEACEVANAFCQRNAPCRLTVNGDVRLGGHTPDVCSFDELIEGAGYTDINMTAVGIDGTFEIGFNPEFLRDTVRCLESDTVDLRLITPLRPGVIVDGDDQFILMPIRLNV